MEPLALAKVKSSFVTDPACDWPCFKRNTILHGRFKVLQLIGKGGFGLIYKAYDMKCNRYVAVKVERNRIPDHYPTYTLLHVESFVFMTLHRSVPAKDGRLLGFPKTYFFGFINPEEKARMLVMEYLGPSLYHLFTMCNYRFSLSTVLLIADQMLERIESYHGCGIIHRDLKPENILIGYGNRRNILHVIDFGLALIQLDKVQDIDDNVKDQRHLGTIRYMSCRAHLRLKQTKKDDLESLIYILAALLNGGKLPWLSVQGKDEEERHINICEMKKTVKMETLFGNVPWDFYILGEKVRNLEIGEEPPYEDYRQILRRLGSILGVNYEERKFDWCGFEGSAVLSDFQDNKKPAQFLIN